MLLLLHLYVQNSKACLISPYRLFKASEGVHGSFKVMGDVLN